MRVTGIPAPLLAFAIAVCAAASSAGADCRGGMPHLGTSPMCTKGSTNPYARQFDREDYRLEMEEYRRSERAHELNARGIRAFENRDFLAAYALFEDANGTYPTATYRNNMAIARQAEANRWNDLGRRAYDEGNLDAAIRYFELAARFDPAYGNNLQIARWAESRRFNEHGRAAYARRDFEAALSLFEQAERSYPYQTYRDNIVRAKDALKWRDSENARKQALAREERAVRSAIEGFSADLARRGGATAERYSSSFIDLPGIAGDSAEAARERLATIRAQRASYSSQIQRLVSEIKNIKVPPPPPTHILEGIILGLTDQAQNVATKYAGTVSPVSHKPIPVENIYATTESGKLIFEELYRGLRDNMGVGKFTLNTPVGRSLVFRLQGVSFGRLFAHSNGATVAEALIRAGVIRVEELNVVGGDRSWSNLDGLQELINTGRVKRVIVWYNPGDPIPGFSSAVETSLVAPKLRTASRFFRSAIPAIADGKEAVQVRYLKGDQYLPESQTRRAVLRNIEAHELKGVYMKNIEIYFGGKPGAR